MSKKEALSYHEITKIAAAAGAQAGVEAFEKAKKQDKKERIDRRLRNTRLLLRKYRLFKMHAARAVFTEPEKSDDVFASVFDILDEIAGYDDSLYVESIRRSSRRTKIIVQHIDTMLELYHAYCSQGHRSEEMRHYRVIRALYIDDDRKTAKQVAELEAIDTRTVYKDVDVAVGILSALFFGIDSVHIA